MPESVKIEPVASDEITRLAVFSRDVVAAKTRLQEALNATFPPGTIVAPRNPEPMGWQQAVVVNSSTLKLADGNVPLSATKGTTSPGYSFGAHYTSLQIVKHAKMRFNVDLNVTGLTTMCVSDIRHVLDLAIKSGLSRLVAGDLEVLEGVCAEATGRERSQLVSTAKGISGILIESVQRHEGSERERKIREALIEE